MWCDSTEVERPLRYLVLDSFAEQQYQSFPLSWFGWVGLMSGTSKPVLGHKNFEIVSLVVNEYRCTRSSITQAMEIVGSG